MKEDHLKYLACPECKNPLDILKVKKRKKDSIESGTLRCSECHKEYDILRHIPRFVPIENYASGFGFQWTKHSRTQYDSYSGTNVSEKRFFEETKWPRDLRDQTVLEVGSGSGRFTEQATLTGAMVVSMDYSYAVDSNYASNGNKSNVLIVQSDIYNMPFKEEFFDKLFCFGVLQHTPDVRKAFLLLPRYLKSGGKLVIDIYARCSFIRQLTITKYWIRPLTKRMKSEILYKIISNYMNIIWPTSKILHKLPYGIEINRRLLIADYRGIIDLQEEILKEWAILDTFDMLSPAFDSPQTIESVKQWFIDAHMSNIDVYYGYNGIEGHGVKP
jgi:SAM-dependent methyltransferase